MSNEINSPPRKKRGAGKVTKTAKDNILAVFNRLGGTSGMADWARENKTDFYRLYGKLIPQAVDVDATVDATLQIEIVRFADQAASQ
jgi:hypothetical protein